MTATEYAVGAFFIAVALFGIIDAIRTPLIVKRFYRDRKFRDNGKVTLETITTARILDAMYTEHHYSDSDQHPNIAQFKAWSTNRRNFTLSKATRKRNRAAWSVTVIDGDYEGLSCLVLPTVVPEAVVYVANGKDIDFGDDVQMANRYHITTTDAELIRSVLVDDVREFLLQPDVIFMELTDKHMVIKRSWSAHKVLDRLEEELNVATAIQKSLAKARAQA